MYVNSFPTSGDLYCLAITFADSLNPDQARQICRAWSGSKLLDTLIVLLNEFFENVNFERNQQKTKKNAKVPSMLIVN